MLIFFNSLGVAMFLRTRVTKSLLTISSNTYGQINCCLLFLNEIKYNEWSMILIFLSMKINQWAHHARKSVDDQWEEKKKKRTSIWQFSLTSITPIYCVVLFFSPLSISSCRSVNLMNTKYTSHFACSDCILCNNTKSHITALLII